MKPCTRIFQAGLLLSALCSFTVIGCDSDSESDSASQAEEHELVGLWEMTEFAGIALPLDMTIDTGYSIYRIEEEGVLTLYGDGQGFADLISRDSYEGESTNEYIMVYGVRLSETNDGYQLRLTRFDSVVFLQCTLGGSTLTCIDNDAEEPTPGDPEAVDPKNYTFERTSTEI